MAARFTDEQMINLRQEFSAHVKQEESDRAAQHAAYLELCAAVEANTALVKDVEKNTAGILEAWNTASGLVKFVKWTSGVVGSLAIIYAAFTHGFQK